MLNCSLKHISTGKLFFILGIALLFIAPVVKAQDTLIPVMINNVADTIISVEKDTLKQKHSPKKAALMSAVLPGLGQAYNKKYWKIPIVYGGLGALGYFITFNASQYNVYRNAYLAKIDDDPNTIDIYPNASEEGILAVINQYRRTRDMLIAGAVLVYALNIIDASVDAHLFEFDVSNDLSLKIEPIIAPDFSTGSAYKGFGIKLRF
jgi:hypothetical protein